jgi:oxaloacetate decarboxylase beta subunit
VNFENFLHNTGFAHLAIGNVVMILIGIVFIYLAVVKDYEPLLLIPIGLGIIVGNVPPIKGMIVGVYDQGSVLYYLYFGVTKGIYPPLIFLGIGAMTDFSTMLSNPKLILLGAAAQIGIFLTFLGSLYLGFTPAQASSIGIIGGADGPTAIFLSSMLAPELLGPIAIAAYSYMALVPVIQPPIMYLFTTEKERKIHMKPPRVVSKKEKILFPIVAFMICAMLAPGSIALLGMLFFGNLLKESQTFLTPKSVFIFGLGALSFVVATTGGVLFAKFMNLFLKEKINPLIGAAGVSAVPDSARVVQMVGQKEDPNNFLLMHAMAPNVAGVIGSAIAAGVLWSAFGKF